MDLVAPNCTETILRDLVHERTGMLFNDEKGHLLLDKLTPLVIERGFQSFLDYYYLLKYDETAGDEWRRVLDVVAVQETFFWREMDQIRALVDILVPQWVERHRGEPLRIWSAACATGEEPLTIAMALSEAGWFRKIPIEIQGTDGSEAGLKKAKCGLFRERALRNLPLAMRNKYFKQESEGWRIDPELQSRVKWDAANLVNGSQVSMYATVPFIFCRNVFIYFSNEMIRRVVHTFADYIQSPAYLFVGVSESLLKISNDFELLNIGEAFVYQRSANRESLSI
ncbi:MAG TPA: protein-glutamate O-methyltransferase CheR [Pyrinomonadaceae bacterium]|jgi:Methylase of chemotaxis methyl-accepting proteins|nr:protein-glutamate O-methyltransferase CheR [Pyrinomonadaceae bacterium]